MSSRPFRWIPLCAAMLGGAGLAGLLHGALAPWPATLWERTAAAAFGNAAVAGAAAALLGLAALVPALRGRLPQPATGFWLGVTAGLVPAATQFSASRPLLAGAGLAGAALAPLLARLVGPGGRRVGALFFLALGGWTLAVGMALRPLPAAGESLLLPAGRTDPVPEGPDVVLVSVDTLRADAVSGERPPGFELPTFDRLRREGTWADYAWSSSNQTLPGHLGMLSGRDAMDHCVRFNLDRVPPGLRLVAEDFLQGGWRTGAVVSNPLVSSEIGFGRGFEVFDDSKVLKRGRVRDLADSLEAHAWLGWLTPKKGLVRLLDLTLMRAVRQAQPAAAEKVPGRGRGRVTNEQAFQLLDQLLADERPYFLFLHYMDVHAPYGAPEEEGFFGRVTGHLPPIPAKYRVTKPDGRFAFSEIDLVWKDLENPEFQPMAAEGVRYLHAAYLEEVMWVDYCVGRVLERIAAADRPTVVLVTADHGEHFGEHGLMTHAVSLFEENLRVPFILWGAGVAPRGRLASPPHLMDVAPTLLGLAGLAEAAESYPGLQVQRGLTDRPHPAVDQRRFSLTAGGRKWIAEWGAGTLPRGTGLFRIDGGPAARDVRLDAAAEPPPELAAAVQAALARNCYTGSHEALTADQKQMLNELGYAGLLEGQ